MGGTSGVGPGASRSSETVPPVNEGGTPSLTAAPHPARTESWLDVLCCSSGSKALGLWRAAPRPLEEEAAMRGRGGQGLPHGEHLEADRAPRTVSPVAVGVATQGGVEEAPAPKRRGL